MFVDHIGAYLFPDILILRIIGRFAFPLFAYALVQGYYLTSDLSKYLQRIFILAFVWQIFHTFFIFTGDFSASAPLNVIYTLFFGLVCIYFIDVEKLHYVLFIFLFSLMLDFYGLGFQYGSYGIALIISIYFYRYEEFGIYLILFLSFILNSVYILFGVFAWIQFFSIFAFLILFFNFNFNLKMPRYFYYLFYPVHILIIIAIKYYSNSAVILQ